MTPFALEKDSWLFACCIILSAKLFLTKHHVDSRFKVKDKAKLIAGLHASIETRLYSPWRTATGAMTT